MGNKPRMANVEGRGIIACRRDGMKVAAGIDVSKGHLDVSISAGKVKRFVNGEEGIEALTSWLSRGGVSVVVCESTGGYERGVVEGLERSGILVWLAHPVRVRALAQAYGQEAKTDALDARMLSRYGELFEPEEVHSLSESERALREVIRRRAQLVEQRVQERNRLEKGLRGLARESTERHIECLDEEIERLEGERGSLLRSDAELLERARLYSSVVGVGEHTAGGAHCWSAADAPAGVGQVQWEVADGAGGTCALVERQWSQAWASCNQGRSWSGEASAVHVGAVGSAACWPDAVLLRAIEEQG